MDGGETVAHGLLSDVGVHVCGNELLLLVAEWRFGKVLVDVIEDQRLHAGLGLLLLPEPIQLDQARPDRDQASAAPGVRIRATTTIVDVMERRMAQVSQISDELARESKGGLPSHGSKSKRSRLGPDRVHGALRCS